MTVAASAAPPAATDTANVVDPSDPTATPFEREGGSAPGVAAAAAASVVNENRPEATTSRRTLWLTLLVLACAAVAATVAVVLIVSNDTGSSSTTTSSNAVALQGSDDDLADFASHAQVVFEEIEARLTQTLILLDIVAVLMASHAMATNQTWPFVVLPHFGLHASRLLPLAAPVAMNVQTMPVVSPELRTAWEAYSAANTNWVDECMAIQETVWRQHTYYGLIQFDSVEDGSSSRVHDSFGDDLPDTHSNVTLPTWQNYPVVPSSPFTYNWDARSTVNAGAFDIVLSDKAAAVSAPYLIPTPIPTPTSAAPVEDDDSNLRADYFRNFIDPALSAHEPASDVVYPIFDNVMSIVSNADDPGNVVGTVMTSFHWRTMLLDVLPENSTATMIAVFACPCSQTFSYQFNATSVEYLGTGALHDAKYNDQGKPNIVNVLGTHALRNVTFPARLSADYCPITVTLYPKLELKL